MLRKPFYFLRASAFALIFAFTFFLCSASSVHADPALWKIQNTELYLMGSIHIADSSLYPLDSIYEQALNSGRFLAVETDITSPQVSSEITNYLANLIVNTSQPLDKILNPQDKVQMDTLLMRLGISFETFRFLPPWITAMQLTQFELARLGYDGSQGIDLHFIQRAKELHKDVISLEDPLSTLKIFADLSAEVQRQMLVSTFSELLNSSKLFEELLSAYKEGNLDRIHSILIDEYYKEPELKGLMEQLLYQRNQGMAQAIIKQIKIENKGMIVVGLAHLVGEQSILEYLEKAGYSIEKVK